MQSVSHVGPLKVCSCSLISLQKKRTVNLKKNRFFRKSTLAKIYGNYFETGNHPGDDDPKMRYCGFCSVRMDMALVFIDNKSAEVEAG